MADWLERNRVVVFATLLNLTLLGLVAFWIRRPQPMPVVIQTATPAATPTIGLYRVYVCGAVVRADVYALPSGAIVKDALQAAGGPAPEADLARVNLALAVEDGDQVYVPAKGEAAPDVGLTRAGSTGKVNINKATALELEALPGIGAVYAQRIVAYREQHGPFETLEELTRVQGIGPATLEQLRDLVALR